MASSARIDELRKKFDENPRRYFAPLANEYRKVGDLEQAIFICQEYLPQQPGHMSGHIVYGQALFEAGRHEEAKAVFETALGLDPENLIALRHLGDIARVSGDPDAARGWYRRVLEADPRNEEIAQLLTDLDGTPSGAPAGEEAPSDAEDTWGADGGKRASRVVHLDDLATADADPGSGASPQAPALDIEQAPDEAAALLDISGFDVVDSGATPAALPSEATPPALPDHAAPEVHEEAPGDSREAMLDLPPALPPDLGLATAEKTAEKEAAEAAAASSPLPGLEAFDGAIPSGASESPAVEGLEDTLAPVAELAPAPTAVPIDGGDGDAESAAPAADTRGTPGAPAEMFVTETMAELYLTQGHLEAAVETYRKLVAQRPDDAGLRARLDDVEAQLRAPAEAQPSASGPTIREFLTGLFSGGRATGAVAEGPEPAASVNGSAPESTPRTRDAGEDAAAPAEVALSGSVDALFIAARRSAADEQAALALAQAFAASRAESLALKGMPARRASDELSLDHVFKKTPARGDASAFSFDQFFSDESAQTSVGPGENPAAPAASGDDVAQFSAWLNGLKKS